MKKTLALILALVMMVALFGGCNDAEEPGSPSGSEPASSNAVSEPTASGTLPTTTEEKLAYAATLSNEELYELAKAESGTMMVYSTTSLCETAMNNFLEKYPDVNGAYSSVGEADMFTKLSTEIGTAAEGADMALLQNSYRMENELISEGLLLNYFPEMYKASVAEEYWDPCVILFCQKIFIYNSTGGDIGLNNVWQLTEEAYADKIFFKDPANEPVGMNFLVMLTGDEWSAKLAEAYKAYYQTAQNLLFQRQTATRSFLCEWASDGCNDSKDGEGYI